MIAKLISTHIEMYYYEGGNEEQERIVELPFSKDLLSYVYSFPEIKDRGGCVVSEERLTEMSRITGKKIAPPHTDGICHVVITGTYDWNL